MTENILLTRRIVRVAPHVIDTVFLLSGIAMLIAVSLNPFTQSWLNAKFAGLLVYIALGMLALRRGPTPTIRRFAFVGALFVFTYVVGVARSHSPMSWIAA